MASAPSVAVEQSVTMLPVEIVPEPIPPQPIAPRGRARRSGMIEITFAGGSRVCVRGEVPPGTLRQVIELLR